MKYYDAVLRVVLRWTMVEISDLEEKKTAFHPLLSEYFGIRVDLEAAAVEKAPNVRWAQPGTEMPLWTP